MIFRFAQIRIRNKNKPDFSLSFSFHFFNGIILRFFRFQRALCCSFKSSVFVSQSTLIITLLQSSFGRFFLRSEMNTNHSLRCIRIYMYIYKWNFNTRSNVCIRTWMSFLCIFDKKLLAILKETKRGTKRGREREQKRERKYLRYLPQSSSWSHHLIRIK